jgi:hypothetical protein
MLLQRCMTMSERELMPDWVADVIRARAIVGALGEPVNDDPETPRWWPSRATSDAGRFGLTQIFPRTAVSAALAIVSRAAAIVHDERIGQPHVVHLFRLPTADEIVISRWVSEEEGAAIITHTFELDATARLTGLRALGADHASGAPSPEGPQRVEVDAGDVHSLRGRTLRRACAVYARAFAAGTKAFPYIEESTARVPQ